MTQTVANALSKLKTVLSTMAIQGGPALKGCWVYPTDYAAIDLDSLPVVLISEGVNVPVTVRREAQRRTLMHQWSAQVQILLMEGFLTDDRSAAEAADMHWKWIDQLVKVVVSNSTLDGAVQGLGVKIPGNLLTYRVGHIPWWKTRDFWGINAMIEVYQMMRHETSA